MPLGVARGVFPSIDAEEGRPGEYYCSRAALWSKNQRADTINEAESTVAPGAGRALHSADSLEEIAWESDTTYPVELLNSLNNSGLPSKQVAAPCGDHPSKHFSGAAWRP